MEKLYTIEFDKEDGLYIVSNDDTSAFEVHSLADAEELKSHLNGLIKAKAGSSIMNDSLSTLLSAALIAGKYMPPSKPKTEKCPICKYPKDGNICKKIHEEK